MQACTKDTTMPVHTHDHVLYGARAVASSVQAAARLNSGAPVRVSSSTSQRCGTGCEPPAGVVAVRRLTKPTGQRPFSLWNAGLTQLMRPSDSTAQHKLISRASGVGSHVLRVTDTV